MFNCTNSNLLLLLTESVVITGNYNMIKSVFFDVPRFIQVINLPTSYKRRKNNRT